MKPDQPLLEVVYTSESTLRQPRQLLRKMWIDLLASRELAWRLLIRNISSRYRQSAFGPVWTFLSPLSTAIAFTFLRGSGVIAVGEIEIPYPFYVMLGVVLWQLFSKSLSLPLSAMKAGQSLFRTIKMPIESLILASVGELLFDQMVQFGILVALLILFQIPLNLGIFLAPFAILMLLCLGLGLGLLLVPVGSLYTDVSSALPIVTQFWFFITPVVYTPPSRFPYSLLVDFNPVSPLLVASRDLFTLGTVEHPLPFVIVSVLSVLLLLIGWVIYRLSIPILIER